MSFREWMAARQLLTEEFLGVLIRQNIAAEDEDFARAKKNVRP